MIIIPKKPSCVEPNRTILNTNVGINNNASKASAESTSGSVPDSCKKAKYFEIQALKDKISFSKVLAADGHRIKKSGRGYSCCCPFHDDRNPSFVVSANDSYAKCYGCDWHGDVIKYEQEYRHLDFGAAVAGLSGKAARVVKSVQLPLPLSYSPTGLTDEQKGIIANASDWLQTESHLWASKSEKRSWRPETIQKLAFDGSLGWYGGALAFLYRTGLKIRNWPHHQLKWEFKSGESFWREQTITGDTTKVYVAEGETDAIYLVDAGMADAESVAVVAVSCAQAVPDNQSLELLRGKEVVLCLDNDSAGENGTKKLSTAIGELASKLSFLNWGGVQ